MSNVTIGLIGYGYWGPNLLRNYMELESATPKWVCDISPEAAGQGGSPVPVARRRRPTSTTSLSDPEVDAVLIATPISIAS